MARGRVQPSLAPSTISSSGNGSPSPRQARGGAQLFRQRGEIRVTIGLVGAEILLALVDQGVGKTSVEQFPLLRGALVAVILLAVTAVFIPVEAIWGGKSVASCDPRSRPACRRPRPRFTFLRRALSLVKLVKLMDQHRIAALSEKHVFILPFEGRGCQHPLKVRRAILSWRRQISLPIGSNAQRRVSEALGGIWARTVCGGVDGG
jgi:hypothetical protein